MTNLWQDDTFRRVVRRQHGRVTWAQVQALGVPRSTVAGWIKAGHLTRVVPKVYAVGHDAPNRMADLWTAVLYAGPGAMLSHESDAHHRGLIIYPPRTIHVSTPRVKIRSISGLITVHSERQLTRVSHDGLPCTTIAQLLLDLAATSDGKLVRRALSVLDYRKQLDLDAIEAIARSGRRGSKALRLALTEYRPQDAHVNGKLEEGFLDFCEAGGIPLPRVNVWVHDIEVDAYWPDQGLVVEMDGDGNHSSPAQRRKDRSKELKLRAHGLRVVRYDWALLHTEPEAMHADLRGQLAAAGEPS
jgi:predicted transcriptional regulator of viral defense system